MGANKTVLVLDDDANLRKSLSDILQANGYDPIAVAKGKTALKRVEKDGPAVALIDLKLGDMTGIEAMKAIKTVSPRTECIVITGHATQESAIEAVNVGAYSYVQKPYDGDQLLLTVRRAFEKRDADEALRESEERYRGIVEGTNDLITRVDETGRFTYLNHVAERVFGLSIDQCLGRSAFDFVHPDDRDETEQWFQEGINGQVTQASFENRQVNQTTGEISHMLWTSSFHYNERDQVRGVNGIARDITERKRSESERETTIDLLGLLNAKNDLHGLMRTVLRFMKELSGCEALGIRLRDGDDFPYYETSGFSEEFVEAERYLCVSDLDGQLRRDEIGNPVLECMCGNVICRRFDPSKSFFTDHGSFVSNCTSELLTSTSEEDRQARTRNRCNAEGYESVALIPLRAVGKTFGLMQFNDRRKGCFSHQFIALAERLADSVAIALAQRKAEEELWESEALYAALFEHNPVETIVVDIEGRVTGFNLAKRNSGGRLPHIGDLMYKDYAGKHHIEMYAELRECIRTGELREYPEQRYGDRILSITIAPFPKGAIVTAQDITERKRAEEELARIFNLSPDMICTASTDGFFKSLNPAWEEVLGFTREELLAKPFRDFVHPDDIDATIGTLEDQAAGKSILSFENRYRCKDGSYRTLEWRGTAAEKGVVYAIARDVTERKRAEEALQTTQKYLIKAQKIARTGSWAWEKHQNTSHFSNETFHLLGYAPNEIEPSFDWLLSIMRPDDVESVIKGIEESMRTGEPYDMEYRLKRKDGEEIAVHSQGEVTFDEKGEATGMIGVIQDITERKKAEEALRESEEKFRRISTAASDAIVMVDSHGSVVFWNMSAERMFGYPHEEAMGKDLHRLIVPTRYHDTFEIGFLPFQKIGEGAKIGKMLELDVVHSDGTEFPVELSLSSVKLQEEWRGAAIIRDITERKRAEEMLRDSEVKFRTLYESSSDAVMLLDEESFLDCNNATLAMFGCATREEFCSRHPADLSPPTQPGGTNSMALVNEQIATALKEGSHRYEWMHRRVDGEDFPAEVLLSAMELGGRRVLQATVRDATQRKQSEDQLRQAQKMEAIGTLAGGIAHDFNNILGAMIGFTELAQIELPPESEASDYLNEVLDASERAKALIGQILTFTRQVETERKTILPHVIVKEALKLLRASIPKTINIVQRIDGDSGTILADPTQFHQTVVNLITNAYQAILPKAGSITVTLRPTEVDPEMAEKFPQLREGPYVELTVSDTGCGMDAETRERIFEPFFTTKGDQQGTGLGLSTVHGIVHSLSGAIVVESEPDKGSTFHVYLPRLLIMAESATPFREPVSSGRGEHILVVDDEEALRRFFRLRLEALGYTVTECAEATEALEAFRASPGAFDLVLTDYAMPGMNGLDLAQELYRVRSDVPVVLATGFSETITASDAGAAGLRRYLQKPLNADELGRVIREVLDES